MIDIKEPNKQGITKIYRNGVYLGGFWFYEGMYNAYSVELSPLRTPDRQQAIDYIIGE